MANLLSVRRTQRRAIDAQQLQLGPVFRHQCCTLRRIAKVLDVLLPNVGRIMRKLGFGLAAAPSSQAPDPAVPEVVAMPHDPGLIQSLSPGRVPAGAAPLPEVP
jgi:hypothetical protein